MCDAGALINAKSAGAIDDKYSCQRTHKAFLFASCKHPNSFYAELEWRILPPVRLLAQERGS
jgi:hypothetical protein